MSISIHNIEEIAVLLDRCLTELRREIEITKLDSPSITQEIPAGMTERKGLREQLRGKPNKIVDSIKDSAEEESERKVNTAPIGIDEIGEIKFVENQDFINLKEDNWKHRASNMRCQTCMWWVPKTSESEITLGPVLGRCRQRSPTIKGFPATFPTDWCGDHKLDENKL